jgi:hypothetical protein
MWKKGTRCLRVGLIGSLLALLPAAAGFAGDSGSGEKGHASGDFASRAVSFGVADAYAFRGTSSFGDDRVLVVAVSNAGFNDDFIGRYRDRRYLLDNFFRDDETALVYFEFGEDGAYRGLSYDLGSGNGCGYCSGGVTSSVHRVGDRLTGSLSQQDAESERNFSIEIDVPIAGEDFGAAQGAGGGDPGRAFLAYHGALRAGDAEALRRLTAAATLDHLVEAAKTNQVDDYLAYLRRSHPTTVTVAEGYVRGDRALVVLDGEDQFGKVSGEALLSRVDGTWRVEDEMYRQKVE